MSGTVYLSPHSLEGREGWEISAPGRWKAVVRVESNGSKAWITTDDGVRYRHEFTDAVLVRAPEAEDQCE